MTTVYKTQIEELIAKHKKYFKEGNTYNAKVRVQILKKLKNTVKTRQQEICAALAKDLGKTPTESYLSEIGIVLAELSCMIKNTKRWSKPKTKLSPLAQFHSKSFVMPHPYGTVLIIGPYNYPFMLALMPLINAIAAGNTAVIKTSEQAPATGDIVKSIIEEVFEDGHVSVLLGEEVLNKEIISHRWDFVFFTGSPAVGKIVSEKAAKFATPVILELGGKCPTVVDKTANIALSAKRIVFGKLLNCGQTCIAVDYIYCDESIKDKLVQEIIKQIKLQYGENPIENPEYGKIINERHHKRILSLIDKKKVIFGGEHNETQIAPTIIDNVTFDDKIMHEEIFGPLLPIVTYKNFDDAIDKLNTLEHPLAFYIFSKNKQNIKKALQTLNFGGGCINDTIIHIATTRMPFGGVGQSGVGSYQGKTGFETFSHYKSIVDKKLWIDLDIRYRPHGKFKAFLLKLFLR